ncbi:MAG: adaptor protein MecA [Lachnospiraceae bacterium]|nr:adaptor protein MecA [Lachnospiraceae bacterium]
MKIEKVNDHQIRCTLTKSDLADRHMKISELAYGTEKVKSLFRDMMEQASYEFGFEAEDIPLMIEAIPLSGDCIVLIITKVEDPEELDTRFSKFSPSIDDEDDSEAGGTTTTAASFSVTADDIIDLFKKFRTELAQTADKLAAVSGDKVISSDDIEVSVPEELCRFYRFEHLDNIIRLAKVLKGYYDGINNIYKEKDGSFMLEIHQSGHSPEDFNRICNIMSEYGQAQRYSKAQETYYKEHGDVFLFVHALQKLAQI